MDLMKLQNLLNECIMIEQDNYLGGKFSVDLAEAQSELDQAKQLSLTDVNQQRELLIAYRTMIEFDIKHEDFEESVEYFLENKESYL